MLLPQNIMWSSHDFAPTEVKYFVSATHSCRLLPGLTPTANVMARHMQWINGNLPGDTCCVLCKSVLLSVFKCMDGYRWIVKVKASYLTGLVVSHAHCNINLSIYRSQNSTTHGLTKLISFQVYKKVRLGLHFEHVGRSHDCWWVNGKCILR